MNVPIDDHSLEYMNLFLRIPLKDYYRVIRSLSKKKQLQRALDKCAVALKNNVFVDRNSKLFCFDKNNATDIEECTIGELLAAASNCFAHRCDMISTNYKEKKLLDEAGIRIVTCVIVVPLYYINHEYLGTKAKEHSEQPAAINGVQNQ